MMEVLGQAGGSIHQTLVMDQEVELEPKQQVWNAGGINRINKLTPHMNIMVVSWTQ